MRGIVTVVLSFVLFSCNQQVEQKVPVVDGLALNANGQDLYFYQQNENIVLLDTISINEQGNFRVYQESVDTVGFYFLQFKNGSRINFFLEPKDFIQLEVDANDVLNSCKSKNSKNSNIIWNIDRNTKELEGELHKISANFKNILGKDSVESDYKSLIELRDSVIQYYKEKALEISKDNNNAVVKWYLLNQKVGNNTVFSLEKDLKLFMSNSEQLMNNDKLKALFYEYDQNLMKAFSHIRTSERYSKGEKLIELKARTNWDEKLPVEKLKAKLIQVVLWNGIPEDNKKRLDEINTLRKKYGRRGFKVLMVAYQKDKEQWNENIARLSSLYWNILDTTGLKSTDLVELGVRSLPFNFLITKESTIVERDLWGSELEKEVEKFLKNY